MDKTRVSIEDFLQIAGVKISTVKKNKDKIPGLTYANGKFDIIKGTRYPIDIHRYKMENSADRRYLLLLAISQYKYIDHLKLRVYPEQFDNMLKELLDGDLIALNHLYNQYGANAYDCTSKGDEIIKMKKEEAIKCITDVVSSGAGHFVGAILSEVYNL